ncbi:hypothetical protein [Chryseobacterium luteum]|uniref:hypothetical protein n=1 Tax=Chryseobacterium luteum TaxID=421531 RepID=UPI0006915080|nr:hypothetical protein [Chryseobacterium luteum]
MNSSPELPKKSKKKWIIISVITVFILISLLFLYNWKRYFVKEVPVQADEYTTPVIAIENLEYLKTITFKVSEYGEIPDEYKKGIVQTFINNDFYEPENDSDKFHLTNIKDRAKKVFAFGNFTGKSEENKPDLAFLVENEDSSSSILFIISSSGDLLLKKRYEGDLPVINSFIKGSKIFMNSPELQASPEDGLILKFKYQKSSIVYDATIKNFEEFHQYSSEELNDMKNPDYEEEEPASGTDNDSIQ